MNQRSQRTDELLGAATLVVKGAAKAFGPTQALVDCDLRLEPGEIHALVGENGSGKSTLIKLLSGVFAPDEGTISWGGRPIRLRRPAEARALGIATVFQEVLIADEASVRDNIYAGADGLVRRGLRRAEEETTALAILDELGLGGINLDTVAGRLSLGQKQLVTVARSMVLPCVVLILDEPTSSLDVEDRERLFTFVRKMVAEKGMSVLFVSHRSDEIQRLADRVTVLRAGKSVATFKGASTPAHLAELMSGRQVHEALVGDEAGQDAGVAVAVRPIRMRAQNVVLVHGRRPFSLRCETARSSDSRDLKVMVRSRFLRLLLDCARSLAARLRSRETANLLAFAGSKTASRRELHTFPGTGRPRASSRRLPSSTTSRCPACLSTHTSALSPGDDLSGPLRGSLMR